MRCLLSAVIGAKFTVMGCKIANVWQCHLALDKWIGMSICHEINHISLVISTCSLTVGIMADYRVKVLDMIGNIWHPSKKITSNELETPVGKIAHIGKACSWVYHLLTHLYASITLALNDNKAHFTMLSSPFWNYWTTSNPLDIGAWQKPTLLWSHCCRGSITVESSNLSMWHCEKKLVSSTWCLMFHPVCVGHH